MATPPCCPRPPTGRRHWTDDVPAASSGPVAEQKEGKRRRGFTRPTQAVLWLGCAMVFAELVEGSMNDWSALHLEDITQGSPRVAPLGIAATPIVMAVARLFGDGWRSPAQGRSHLRGSAAAAATARCLEPAARDHRGTRRPCWSAVL
ncbi:hypothetical protein [Streptomyces sp. NPDC014676]|uniref:hypothetical protein n=1 Tax=Streptomyces sp. NPDC014676 TaxID=3364879 RepID=UPI0036F81DE3